MGTYSGVTAISDARQRYFQIAGFAPDGGYGSRWVKLNIGPAVLVFPNTSCRVRSVRLHDVHHILTEYETTWTGEAEIAAWEIASGCRDHHVAWLLDLAAVAVGLVIAPKRTFGAFVRGRRSRNLYNGEFRDALLSRTVGDLRRELDIPEAVPPSTGADLVAFAWWSAVAMAVTAGPFVLAALIAAAALYVL